ncbi:xyloside xylosyltransferase 1 isoform X2 [Nothobranchius furzeri]|uniref:Transcript variant X1 n=1 Tax=Nothobranchius furzeri TaxID=105023 RepID=A0A1A8VGN2_NOTFU|nr:xyloside xylosyltransferase 1 [Nothobranchius furzeri]KAF7202418.1 transcript variant X1 [Nothobranchius furzeri]KAF7202419.1 transcript variant X2 [Nothobranchius furzeri]
MGFLKLLARIMGRVSTFRSYQFVLLLAATLAVVAFYYFGSERHSFSSTTKRIKQTQASSNRNDADLTVDTMISHLTESEEQGGEDQEVEQEGEVLGTRRGDVKPSSQHYHALMMFTKVDRSRSLQEKFRVAMLSLVKHGHFLEGEMLVLHFVSDQASQELGQRMLQEFLQDATFKYEISFHDVVELTHKLYPIVEAMQKHFSAGSGAYYSDSIFFLSVAMHLIMPESLTYIVQLDLDLKYRTNIRNLFQEFDKFPPGAVIGIAREMQPVYRHTFWQYRKENPNTRVGEPPPEGLPGFNSGVMLLDLSAMRESSLYNQLLKPNNVAKLADQYRFKGHLGDQDFFSMIGMEHPELFYSLACGWNRQLCTWWRDHGYGDVFQLYYRCDGPVYIYHGNCNSPIPDD